MNQAPTLINLNERAFAQAVNSAFRQYQSLLALAHSPLAESALLKPLLVMDDVSPSAEERGRALRLLLSWAVEQLAPETSAFPIGSYRDWDDPTWRDPLWWGYNILRHRYLEPLHPDDFVEGGRYTETLLSLTGIPSEATYFDERNRAIRDVAQRLQLQIHSGSANGTLRLRALKAVLQPLQKEAAAQATLAIAATFRGVFARDWLIELAVAEHIDRPKQIVAWLVEQRYLRTASNTGELWLSSVLREHLYAQQAGGHLRQRHQRIAQKAVAVRQPLVSAFHSFQAEQYEQAATLLLDNVGRVDELDLESLRVEFGRFRPHHLPADLWCQLLITLSDLHVQAGEPQQARAACRRALAATDDTVHAGRIFRRLGKLHETDQQQQALTYYEEALARLPSSHPEYVDTLKDRGWLYILRRAWASAESDLQRARQLAPDDNLRQQADINDALSHWYSNQGKHEQAVTYGKQALTQRELLGDTLRTARSLHNLAFIWVKMGQFEQAVASFQEALTTFQRLRDAASVAAIQVSLGTTFHFMGKLTQAVTCYNDGLALARQAALPLLEVKAHGNLAEGLAELGHYDAARHHFKRGLALAELHGFADQTAYFAGLQKQLPVLQIEVDEAIISAVSQNDASSYSTSSRQAESQPSDPIEQLALDLAAKLGRITAKQLMAEGAISKATATRRLSSLVEQGLLLRQGQKRGTYYVLSQHVAGGNSAESSALNSRLQTILPYLKEHHQVEQATFVQAARPSARLALAFTQTPNLAQFFQLEALLSQHLNAPIDLIPQNK